MSSKNLNDPKKKVSSEDLDIETDEKTDIEVEEAIKAVVEIIKEVDTVKTIKGIENDSNKKDISSIGSNSSRSTKINMKKNATLNHEYDRRLNPDAPVFVPRTSTFSASSSSLAQKTFSGAEGEKNTSCGGVYDSIWSENSIAPRMPPVQSLVSRPKLPSSHMMMSSPMSRHFHPYGATNSASGPGFRSYLTSQGFYELRRTQSNMLALQPLNVYASANATAQPLSCSNLNVEKKLSPVLPMKSIANMAFMSNSPADVGKVEAVDSIEGNKNDDTEVSKAPEEEEPEEKSPIKSKMRGVLVHKSSDNNYDPCDVKYGGRCCCSLM